MISGIYGVSYFRIPLSLGAMVSFFSLSLSCLNAGSRIIYPMGQHLVFPRRLGTVQARNGTPHVAITSYVAVMFLIPAILEINTNPLTTFGDAGTLAACGFLLAYFLITIAAPAYLAKGGRRHSRRMSSGTARPFRGDYRTAGPGGVPFSARSRGVKISPRRARPTRSTARAMSTSRRPSVR